MLKVLAAASETKPSWATSNTESTVMVQERLLPPGVLLMLIDEALVKLKSTPSCELMLEQLIGRLLVSV